MEFEDPLNPPFKNRKYPDSDLKKWQNLKNSFVKIVIFLFPVFLALFFLGIKIWLPRTYNSIVQEDTAIEYLQAAFFFLASIISFFICGKFFKERLMLHGVLFACLSLGLFFVSMEEISWGQRIFNIENPEFFNERNMQEELTVHNLDTVANHLSEAYILTGLFGAFGWLLVSAFSLKRRIPFVNLYVPAWFISSYFFFVLFTNTLFSKIRPFAVEELGIEKLRMGYFFIYRDQEPAEFILSIGFLLFASHIYIRLKNTERKNGTLPAGYFKFNQNAASARKTTVKDREAVSKHKAKEETQKLPRLNRRR